MASKLLSILEGPWEDGTRPADLYEEKIARRPSDHLSAVLEGLVSKNKRVQGGCAEIASRLSADHPEMLYPHIEVFVRNLRAKEPILRWEAVCTIGNLTGVDDKKLIADHVDEIAAMLAHKSIVLQGHAVRALAKIAASNPKLAKGILASLTGATRYFPGSRVGYIVEAMEQLAQYPALAASVRTFLTPYADSDSAPVARKAKKALKRVGTPRQPSS